MLRYLPPAAPSVARRAGPDVKAVDRGLAPKLVADEPRKEPLSVSEPSLVWRTRPSVESADGGKAAKPVMNEPRHEPTPPKAPSTARRTGLALAVLAAVAATASWAYLNYSPAPPQGVVASDPSGQGQKADIPALLAQARADFAALRLTAPAGGNALELKAFERQAEQLEKKQAEAKRQAEAAKKAAAAAEAKRKAEAAKKAAEAKRQAAQRKAEEERRAAEQARSASEEAAGRKRATEAAFALAGEFLDIPGGSFQMGCSPGDGECDADERPVHTVTIKPFRIGKYEVTVGQFRQFVEAAGYRTDAERGEGCAIVQTDGQWAYQAGSD